MMLKVICSSNFKGVNELVPLLKKDDELHFFYQKCKFVFNEERKQFEKLSFSTRQPFAHFKSHLGYKTQEDIDKATAKFGRNEFDIPMPTFMDLYKEQALAPFFLFQVFCVMLWCLDDFIYYSLFILFMLLSLEAIVATSRLKNISIFRNMKVPENDIQVYRMKSWKKIKTTELLPGDLVLIQGTKEDQIAPCDLLLLTGSCVTNEAMLTGESTPQLKENIETLKDNDVLDVQNHKLHIVSGGTKIIQHTNPEDGKKTLKSDGCVAYVLRTGFQTTQGKLVRTMLFSSERVTENNKESFAFIGVLLVVALAASGYVLREGLAHAERSKWKLLLECTLIITSVVPPELPMELSLAVNTSLVNLMKEGIFCTEPFRIPYAGKVKVCAFDKTGTLTQEHLIMKGVDLATRSVNINDEISCMEVSDIPTESKYVMAACHSIANLNADYIGDPIEIAALNHVGWSFNSKDIALSKSGPKQSLKIRHRFHFSADLKRMSTIVSLEHQNDSPWMCLTKGAPETIQKFLKEVPKNYVSHYKLAARKGYRVIAMAYKPMNGAMTPNELRQLERSDVEKDLIFCGLMYFECPLKKDSHEVVQALNDSSHITIMVTGDNALTACEVSSQLEIVTKPTLILTKADGLRWVSVDETVVKPFEMDEVPNLSKDFDFCITGDTLDEILPLKGSGDLIAKVHVFARTSPGQKTKVIDALNQNGFTTLMCGDGTNDVGALKQSHVGVALLANANDPRLPKSFNNANPNNTQDKSNTTVKDTRAKKTTRANVNDIKDVNNLLKQQLETISKEESTVVQLGDASIASPFTSKGESVMPILSILRQGRCTLVTTLQMFKILALNSLVDAYSLSVLSLDGIKKADGQATMLAMFTAACFLFNSRTQPLKKLSKERPVTKLFSLYTVLSAVGQSLIHLTALIYVSTVSKQYLTGPMPKPDEDFQPNIVNSAVFIISAGLQLSTFVVNYQGHPFMQSIPENKGLLYCIGGLSTILIVVITQLVPDFNESLSLVIFPSEFQKILLTVLVLDFTLAYLVEWVCKKLFR